jgi:hypothetical protein
VIIGRGDLAGRFVIPGPLMVFPGGRFDRDERLPVDEIPDDEARPGEIGQDQLHVHLVVRENARLEPLGPILESAFAVGLTPQAFVGDAVERGMGAEVFIIKKFWLQGPDPCHSRRRLGTCHRRHHIRHPDPGLEHVIVDRDPVGVFQGHR